MQVEVLLIVHLRCFCVFAVIVYFCIFANKELVVPYRIVHVYCQEWTDKRLAWNASEFENITYIIVKSKSMWVPDVTLINR